MTATHPTDAVRTFLCVEMPQSVRERIEALQRELRRLDAPASWVKPANLHLTLKFLGDVEASRLAEVIATARRVAAASAAFPLTVSGAGCFPSPRQPRVLWVGMQQPLQPLERLHRALEDELAQAGFARDSKAFKPHLTIARLRQPRAAARLAEELIRRGFAAETFLVSELIVMQSELSPQGSRYTPLSVTALAG